MTAMADDKLENENRLGLGQEWDLKRCLNGQEYLLLLQREDLSSQHQHWQLITPSNTSSRRSNPLSWLFTGAHICTHYTETHN